MPRLIDRDRFECVMKENPLLDVVEGLDMAEVDDPKFDGFTFREWQAESRSWSRRAMAAESKLAAAQDEIEVLKKRIAAYEETYPSLKMKSPE